MHELLHSKIPNHGPLFKAMARGFLARYGFWRFGRRWLAKNPVCFPLLENYQKNSLDKLTASTSTPEGLAIFDSYGAGGGT